MTPRRFSEVKSLEGRQVSFALADGSRIDDCQLVSSGRHRPDTVWIFVNGTDAFFPVDQIVDCWETGRPR